MIVVSDTTPIISLLKIGWLDLLKLLFGRVLIPEAVYRELTSNAQFESEAEQVRQSEFLEQVKVEYTRSVELLSKATGLDQGESEAIVYSDENSADLLLMDEAKGRQVAKQMGFHIMGTVGILLSAHQQELLRKDEILGYLDILRHTGRHISEALYQQLIEKLN